MVKLRRMCGGGTWKREHLTDVRHLSGRSSGIIWDYAGVALVTSDPANDWPRQPARVVWLRWRSHALTARDEAYWAAQRGLCRLRGHHRPVTDNSGVVYCGACGCDPS